MQVTVPKPDVKGRTEILNWYLKKIKVDPGVFFSRSSGWRLKLLQGFLTLGRTRHHQLTDNFSSLLGSY